MLLRIKVIRYKDYRNSQNNLSTCQLLCELKCEREDMYGSMAINSALPLNDNCMNKDYDHLLTVVTVHKILDLFIGTSQYTAFH